MTVLTNASIESFNQYGNDFWDKNGPYRTLHQINPARLRFIESYAKLSGKKVLDIGCGGGVLAEAMAKKGAIVSAIDLSSSVLTAAREHLKTQPFHIDYREISSKDCAASGEKYEYITCMEVLEHVPNPGRIFQDISTMLEPGSYAFFSTLNRNFKSHMMAVLLAEYLTTLVPKGTHDSQWFIKPEELVAMAEHAELTPIAFAGLDYHPLLKTAMISRNCEVNYLFVAQKPSE